MNRKEFEEFFKTINKYTEQEIIKQIPEIKKHFRYLPWRFAKEKIKRIFKYFDKKKILYEFFKDEEKFSWWGEKLDIPERLKFGLEIEVGDLPLDEIKYIFKSKAIVDIMKTLQVPDSISSKIIKNSVFEKKNEYNKWNFSPEAASEESEASSPIFRNKLEDLNQIGAICTLLKALGAKVDGGTGLHINIGVDYLECNKKAIDNVLKIWEECEELLFKMANKEGEVIRIMARNMATPIKENIQDFYESDGSITLNTEEDMERFLYKIQAKNRMRDVISGAFGLNPDDDFKSDLYYANTNEERFKIFHRYNEWLKRRKEFDDSDVRWTSINLNHMRWNYKNPGRIEIRIFNSSLDPKIIFQDLLLVAKIFEISLENAKNSKYKKKEFENLCMHNVTEEKKVDNLLSLLFDAPEQKKIFKRRWRSVKDDKEYINYRSGRDTFER